MFESWLEQEKAAIKSRYGAARVFCVFIAVLMAPFVLSSLVMLLDGSIGFLFVLIFEFFVIGFALSMGNYKKKFVKPLLTSVQQELTTEEARQKFAQQMREQAVCISYRPLPQTKACDIMVAKDYCYMRQPGKSCIIHNDQSRRVILTREDYYVGYRGHMRWCYALALYTTNPEKPVWKGYFMDKNAVYQAFMHFKDMMPAETEFKDLVTNPEKAPKRPLWKRMLEWILFLLFMAVIIYCAFFINKDV